MTNDHQAVSKKMFHSLIYTYLLQSRLETTASYFLHDADPLRINYSRFLGHVKEKVDKLWNLYLSKDQHKLNELKNIYMEHHNQLKNYPYFRWFDEIDKCHMQHLEKDQISKAPIQFRLPHPVVLMCIHRSKRISPCKHPYCELPLCAYVKSFYPRHEQHKQINRHSVVQHQDKNQILENPIEVGVSQQDNGKRKDVTMRRRYELLLAAKANILKRSKRVPDIMPCLPSDIINIILSKDPQIRFYNALYRYMMENQMFKSFRHLRKESGVPFLSRQYFNEHEDKLFDFKRFWDFYIMNRMYVKCPCETDQGVFM